MRHPRLFPLAFVALIIGAWLLAGCGDSDSPAAAGSTASSLSTGVTSTGVSATTPDPPIAPTSPGDSDAEVLAPLIGLAEAMADGDSERACGYMTARGQAQTQAESPGAASCAEALEPILPLVEGKNTAIGPATVVVTGSSAQVSFSPPQDSVWSAPQSLTVVKTPDGWLLDAED